MRGWMMVTLCLSGGLIACDGAPMSPMPSVSTSTHSIVGGVADSEHHSVGAIVGPVQGRYCTGTIVKKTPGNKALALTAAHCLHSQAGPPLSFRIGQDIDGRTEAEYPVLAAYTAPGYKGAQLPDGGFTPNYGRDVGILELGDVPESQSVSTVVDPSVSLPVGSSIVIVGHGRTAQADGGLVASPLRLQATLHLNAASAAGIEANHPTGGGCYGDSGGPIFAQVDGEERLVGISNSIYSTDCVSKPGVRGMYLPAFDTFVRPILEANPSCGACIAQSQRCTYERKRCSADPDCMAIHACYVACQGEAACEAGCDCTHAGRPSAALLLFQQTLGACLCKNLECGGLCPSQCESTWREGATLVCVAP